MHGLCLLSGGKQTVFIYCKFFYALQHCQRCEWGECERSLESFDFGGPDVTDRSVDIFQIYHQLPSSLEDVTRYPLHKPFESLMANVR